jgi:very-short-patch-repair endonuclease
MPILRANCARWKFDFARECRKNPTKQEAAVWQRVRYKQLGVRVRRQSVILGFVADFYVPRWSLVIEIDGPSHTKLKQVAYDRVRENAMAAVGLRTIRFSNWQVDNRLDDVISRIREAGWQK